MERAIGEQAMAILDRTQLAPSRLPAQRRRELDVQFRALVAGLPREFDYQLAFRHAPKLGPNAFALPDGRLVVTDQLVELAASDAEVLAVLAHEAGHHEHRHGMRQALEGSAVVLVAGFLFGDLSGTGSLSVSVPVLLLESGFSRDHEREAVAFAFALLRRHGRSPADFATIMRRLSDYHGERDFGPVSYLSTHPPSRERIDAAARAGEAPPAVASPE
jgi:Zn-dependent protease with chaperone function